MAHEWHVGQEVTVHRGRDEHMEFRTIAKVTKTSVVDSEGGRWTTRGDRWGESRSKWSVAAVLRPTDPGDRERKREAVIAANLSTMRRVLSDWELWKQVDDETVQRVYAMVKEARDG